jgi:hypothetical protein
MRKQWTIVAAAMILFFLCVFGAAAQGPNPQGVGSKKAVQKSDAPRSYNPIKWIKKSPNTTTEKPKKTKNKPSEKSATPDASAPPPKA